MRVLIIEDETPAFRRLQKLLESISDKIEILEVIDSVEMALAWFRNHTPPDLVFMDIQLADGLSFEIFQRIDVKSPVIFTTAHDEYALQAFKVNSIDYLLKPIEAKDLAQSLQKFQSLKEQFGQEVPLPNWKMLQQVFQKEEKVYKSRFLVKLGERLISVPEEEIAYFLTEEKLVLLFTQAGQKYAVDYTLDDLENMLNPRYFFRLNRQCLARLEAIAKIHQYFKGKLKVFVHPPAQVELIVSRERSSTFKAWLDQ
ncbi:MAG: response regulator transcription factor [Microscillaceae bacterium]|nr:response regulator transcription factor [Microscillaceae bacterium]